MQRAGTSGSQSTEKNRGDNLITAGGTYSSSAHARCPGWSFWRLPTTAPSILEFHNHLLAQEINTQGTSFSQTKEYKQQHPP